MSVVSENGILEKKDYDHFKSTSIRLKFMMQLFGALAAATFIGVLGVMGQALMVSEAVLASAAAEGAVVGLAAVNWPIALGLLGVGLVCTVLSCKYMFENVTLDQDFNAKKIAAATTKAQALSITAQQPEQTKPVAVPGMAAHEQHVQEEADGKWSGKFASREQRAETHAPKQHGETWAEEIRLSDQHEAIPSRSIH